MPHIQVDNYIKSIFSDITTYIFTAKVEDIIPIYYVAVRGVDNTEGAVQRVLNKRRISAIKDFILQGNMFFNTFILNWTDSNYSLMFKDSTIQIPIIPQAAQVIDGQHRLEGLKAACEINPEIGKNEIVVIMTEKLTTKQAASIFLNINAEQKPVPKSLVYDLFGEIKDKNSYIVRATDLAQTLNDDKDSPYYQCVKQPGQKQGKVDLSTVVNALKTYTADDGLFNQYNLSDFESQYKVLYNFTQLLRVYYDSDGEWLKSQNPFMTNAGFFAMTQFLCELIIPKCVEKKSFEQKTMRALIPLNEVGLLFKEDIKNMQGKEQRNEVLKYLKGALLREVPNTDEYRF